MGSIDITESIFEPFGSRSQNLRFRECDEQIMLTKEIVKTATDRIHRGVRYSLALPLKRQKRKFQRIPSIRDHLGGQKCEKIDQ